jgi:signal transduction histidine kinase
MTSHPPGPGQAADSPDEEREWLPAAAFVFVILALIALAAFPSVLLNRAQKTADDLTATILPANDALRDLAFAMEERVVSSRSRILTDDPRYDRRLAEAKRAEVDALRTLTGLAPRFGVTTTRYFDGLRRHMARRDSIEAEIVRDGEELEAHRGALPRFDALRDSMVAELAGIRRELMRAAQARTAEEARWARRQRVLSSVLGTVALLAALVVGWFALRQRRLRREMKRALEEANQQRAIAERRGNELERATEARARMLRGVTHDVKNPLGAAKGYAQLLEMEVRAPLLPEQAPLVTGIVRSVDGALAIIADLLDLARTDSGGLAVNRVVVEVGALATEAAEGHRPAAEAAGHSVEVQPPAEEVKLCTDPVRVGQVLGNLLSNAIKYTPPPGRITVSSGARSGDGAPGTGSWATIQVSDTGPGIPREEREAVFDEFTRLGDASAQKGHGLGLAIARRIARLLGGDLTVEDAPGGGASFVLWLPLRDEDARPGRVSPPADR